MNRRNLAWCVAGLLLLLLCVPPALASPDAVSYEEYVTLIHDQGAEGGCIGLSMTHVLEILKEMEAPYTPDPSYAFLNYVFYASTAGGTDPRVPSDSSMNGWPIEWTFGLPPETSFPTNFDHIGKKIPDFLAHPPPDAAFSDALAYRVQDGAAYLNNPTVAQAEDWLATRGPVICGLFPAHSVALVGYDRSAQEFTIVDSANWMSIHHAGIKKVPYTYFASRQPNMSLESVANRPSLLTHPYTARIRISHEYRRSFLTVKIGAVGHDPVTVWDQNNFFNYTDMGKDLAIDVPLPAYAAEHWPPSDQNPWYVQVTNHDEPKYPHSNTILNEVTLARRYYSDPPSSAVAAEAYTQRGLPRTIRPGTTELIFPNSVTVTAPNGGETWAGGDIRTITWNHRGLTGANLTIQLRRGWGTVVSTIAPSVPGQAGTWDWQVPTDIEHASDYYVWIENLDDPQTSDRSDGWVTINTPAATFTASPVTGLSPLAVQFTDTSPGSPTAWLWTFGDGQTSTTKSPSHAYANPGTYSVMLRATYQDGGARQVTKANLVTVYQSLHAAFTVGSGIGYAPHTAVFSDETTGNPTSWHWDFGDGGASAMQNPSHTYLNPGNYTVRLIVTNPYDTKTATKTDYIRVRALWNGLIRTEAEDYDYDHPTEGIGYHDTTPGNSGGAYRSDDVDIASISLFAAGYAVNDTAEGEWARYWVMSPAAENHTYPLSLRLAGWGRLQQTITATVVGMPGSVEIPVPSTGSATSFTFANATLQLKPGLNIVRFTYHGSSTSFDFFTLDPSGIPQPTPTPGWIATVPGAIGLPTCIALAGKYDDVNGNSRKDFADVVLYFNQMSWIAANEPAEGFDYNNNRRVDFADVVWLFGHL